MTTAGSPATRFTGYDREDGKAKVLAIVKGSELVPSATAGDEVAVMTDVSPFYGESGGQVGGPRDDSS